MGAVLRRARPALCHTEDKVDTHSERLFSAAAPIFIPSYLVAVFFIMRGPTFMGRRRGAAGY